MYQGKHGNAKARKGRRRYYIKGRMAAMILSTVLLLALAIGGTVAWLTANTGNVANTFTPSHVTCEVNESFDGETKSNVNVTNTSDIYAYIRVKLVTYRTNDQGQHIGGTAEIPAFEPGAGWVEHDGYYYYTSPVKPGEKPAANLINSIELTGSYNDADGGRQAIEVMAEAIQSVPEDAVKAAWGVSISPGNVTTYNAGNSGN